MTQASERGNLEVRKGVVARLLEGAQELPFDEEKAELAEIFNIIQGQSDLADYADIVTLKLSAKKLTPVTTNISTTID